MAKFLIVYAHPNHDGYHACFLKHITDGLTERKLDYELVDLYAVSYDPVLRYEEHYSSGHRAVTEQNMEFQRLILEADRLIFIYPTWWDNMPAILKGWVDRVFVSRFGFVYKMGIPIGRLHGKKAAVFTASGAPRWYTALWTHERALKALTHDVLRFCGVRTRGFRFGSTRTLNDSARKKLGRIAARALSYLA